MESEAYYQWIVDKRPDAESPIPRWWIILWAAWGTLIGGLVLLFDKDLFLAIVWPIGGLAIGIFAMRLFRPCSGPLLAWYRHFSRDGDISRAFFKMLREGNTESDEFKRLQAAEHFNMSLPLAPLFGMFHGSLIGPVVGALSCLDDTTNSAFVGAAVGLFLGPILVAFLASATLTCIVSLPQGLPFRVRLARRALLLVSPLLIFPAAFVSIQALAQHKRRDRPEL